MLKCKLYVAKINVQFVVRLCLCGILNFFLPEFSICFTANHTFL
jgi:hypothetical protein